MSLLTVARRRTSPAGYPTAAPYNVGTYLTIPTYDGSGEAVHLDVIDFGTPWNGWRFWMSMTPYPNYNDSLENPSIVVSQDGLTWQVPAGLTNPLYLPAGAYNNDPDLVYDPDTDELVLFYRDFKHLKAARSADGATWPATATSVDTDSGISPSLLRTAGGVWQQWTTTKGYRTAAQAEGPYTLVSGLTGLTPTPWHFNVAAAPGGGYHMIYHVSASADCYVASSTNGTAWTVNPVPVLVSGTQPWSMSNLYRPAFTLHEDGDRYRVWYCGVSPHPTVSGRAVWRIGYTEIPLTEWPTP